MMIIVKKKGYVVKINTPNKIYLNIKKMNN